MSIPFDPHVYIDQPYEVSLETLTLCNAACVFCPYPTLERKGTKMDDRTIIELIQQMAKWEKPFFFSPFKVNEPFLDTRTIDICRDVTCFTNARLRLFTNGSPLTEQLVRDISALENVEHLWVSLNADNKEDYERIMSLPWERTTTKLTLLHQMVEYGEFRHPVVLSKVCPTNDQSNTDFLQYCRTRWPHFTPRIIKQDGWLGYVPPSDPRIPDTPCARWWELSILSTGKVSLCCMDGKGDFYIGDVAEHSLIDIYNDPFYRTRREFQLSRRSIFPCSTCTY